MTKREACLASGGACYYFRCRDSDRRDTELQLASAASPRGRGRLSFNTATEMAYHTVVQGEYLSGIAKQYGFSSYKAIWDHAQNAALKKQRQNPNVIYPGDQLFIPEKRKKQETRSTGATHRFLLKAEKLKLRLVVEDLFQKPVDNATCELRVESEVFQLKTDGKGKIEQDIPAGARSAVLTVKDPRTPLNEIVIPIKIGDMDPVDKESGQKARLNNLGYFAGPIAEDKAEAPDAKKDESPNDKTPVSPNGKKEAPPDAKKEEENKALFLSAVEEFQCDHGLVVDGKCGPTTQAKLKQVHGC